jgi:hypothetical protein
MGAVVQNGRWDGGKIVAEERADIPSWKMVNRAPFVFAHSLARHPLFDISRLAGVAADVIRRGDPNKYGVRFENAASSDLDLGELSAQDQLVLAMQRIEHGGAWLKMSALHELDPAYDDIRKAFIAEVEELTRLPLREEVSWSGLSVFIASPNMVTPYHFDHDVNFLFQIRGEKDVHLFDQSDRSVLTEPEIEQFYLGHALAGIFRESMRHRATCYRIVPGTAVHQPPLAPHLIVNADNVSVSVSIWFALRSLDDRARVYQANYCLRRLGLRPRAPEISSARDYLKSTVLRMMSKPKPKTQRELLYSGVDRIAGLLKTAKHVARGHKH